MLSIRRAPNLGTSWCPSPCLCPTRFRHHRHFSPSRLPLTLAIPMASSVTFRRQLAPTVGQAEASTGVKIRTRFSSASGGSHASGLILRRGAIDYVVDYSARHGVGALVPPGVSLQIGSHRLFIGSFLEAYPKDIRIFSCITDPLSTGDCIAAPGGEDGRMHATVMMAGHLHRATAACRVRPGGPRRRSTP